MDFAPGYEDFATRYYWARLLTPPKCCGCFSNHFGSGIACLIWAGFSFYFAVLAFMQKSPFYSHLDQIPLIIFGVVNLIFGCISVAGFVIVYFRPIYVRVQIMVYIIAISGSLVLISTLVNFILFVVNQDNFRNWCIDHSRENTLSNIQNQNENMTPIELSDMDYYNCDRLFSNQVKWSLLCVIAMYIIYVHWMLVYAGFAGTSFFLIPPRNTAIGMPPPPPMESLPPPPTTIVPPTELSNLPPSNFIEKDIEQQQTFYNLKSSTKKSMEKKKSIIDLNTLSLLGLKVNESGQIIHMTNDQEYLPHYDTTTLNYYDDDNHYYSVKKDEQNLSTY
ncbi:hypothetical protein BDC45DRAFT_510766 [Circinella umbellata]|nr:hypothetical protein BDC45DRAFT_510766 [Circinella umbellata]